MSLFYTWVNKDDIITNLSGIKKKPGTMYHFSSGNDGAWGVPTKDVYVINDTYGGVTSVYNLDDVQLDARGNPILYSSMVLPKPNIPNRDIKYLSQLFKKPFGPAHEVKSSLGPPVTGGRKNKKSHKKSQKKSNKKNKTTRNKRK